MNVYNLSFDDITLYPQEVSKYKSREEIKTELVYDFPSKQRSLYGNAIIAANMSGTGTISMAKALAKKKCFTALHKYHSNEEILSVLQDKELIPYVFYTIGMNKESQEQVKWLDKHIDFNKIQVCFEVANGYMQSFLDTIDNFTTKYPNCIVMAGNIISPELIKDYTNVGVDIIKVGIGNGSACSTSNTAAIGIPQYSVVANFAERKDDFFLCSDGGCRNFGDIVKAVGSSSDWVMLGKLLAGTDEAHTSKFLDDNGQGYCEFYGMASNTAMNKYGERKSYRAAEGKTIQIPYVGPVSHVIDEILGSLRSASTYLNCTFD